LITGELRLPLPLRDGAGGRGLCKVDNAATTLLGPLPPAPSRKGRGSLVATTLVVAICVLSAAAALRSFEYDEGYSIFVTSGVPRPAWPTAPFVVGSVRGAYAGHASLWQVARDLRQMDVHPPLYFWALALWRRVAGNGLFAARMLSVLFAAGALAAVAGIAEASGVPPVTAMVFTLGCYGFAYTGAIARGFALAQMLTLCGVLLALVAARFRPRTAFAAGLTLGAATFANYLAVFVGAATLLWLGVVRLRAPRVWLAAALGFVLLLPADFWFFVAQRNSRAGQFPPFEWVPSLARLARSTAGAVLGGLPLYVADGAVRVAVDGLLSAALATLAGLVVWRWRSIGALESRLLLGLAVAAPLVGLILLGLVFDTTPIELRYLSFATPLVGLLIAGALASLPPRAAWAIGGGLACLQVLALLGLLTRPETMQPARGTAAAAAALAGSRGLVLLPRGNDGVGVVGPFLAESPDWLHVVLVGRETPVRQIVAAASMYPRIVLALVGADADSRAVLPAMRAAFADRCWHPAGVGFNTVAFDRICPIH
jgi:Dolichyl-phosphate-mannose-protein mannosyltransferase